MSYSTPPPPPSYGAPQGQYGGGADHPKATTILVMGIISLVCCSILGPFAAFMGKNALQEIDASNGQMGGRGTVQAGMICGIIGSVFLVLAVLYLVFVVLVLGTSGF